MLIRKAVANDYRLVEEVAREAFWNLYTPGCNEHLIMHNLRNSLAYIPELDFVAIQGNKIVGQIIFSHAHILDAQQQQHPVITFGPISVLPEFQKQGIGSALIAHSKKQALAHGYNAIVIYGYPEYYQSFGFESAKQFNISDPDGRYPAALLALPLIAGALTELTGAFYESSAFHTHDQELAAFELGFPFKEPLITETQHQFARMCETFL